MASYTNKVVKSTFTQKNSDGNYEKIHFESETDQVLLSENLVINSEKTLTTSDSTTTALKEILGVAKNGGVTSVNNRTGAVTLSKSDVGLGNVNNVAITSAQVAQIETNKNNIASNATKIATAQKKADDAYSLAQGRAKAVAYATEAAMKTALKAMNNTTLAVGDNIFIKEIGVPDYWVSAILSTNTGETGYYEISYLESQKVDLSEYQSATATNNAITAVDDKVTAVTTRVGALESDNTTNKSNISAAQTKANANEENITKIKNGTITVGKSTTATGLATGRDISSTGDVTWKVNFDGSKDVSATATLANSGVTAGTYTAVTVDSKGRVTAGAKSMVYATSLTDTALNDLAIGGFAIIGE